MKLADYPKIQLKPGDIVVGIGEVPLYISKSIDTWCVNDHSTLLVLRCVWSSLENSDMVYVVEMKTKLKVGLSLFTLKGYSKNS